ncbi:MAG: peptide-methionine (R)-S-oxide reductase MsrB [Kordiimonadaceae bacterium]|nr:peptide-methionine (R)-S-oxide reductase MsrB [Kordiimonadaceae bacterium]MBT6031948.1 peptide-methionine (R)-S-oxide reductase MsrB [Kordiimonadaceae bacterium]
MMSKSLLIKIFLFLVVVGSSVWTYNWYLGKTAPSLSDVSTRVEGSAVAYVAGGCFWCTESDFEKVSGVVDVVSGYMGGHIENPSYNQVVGGDTGHREMVKITFDPSIISYRALVLELFRETDPTDPAGSFYDRGYQYTSAIYYQNEVEKKISEEVIAEIEVRKIFDLPIATAIDPAGTFWVAEKYHQNFYATNTTRYNIYRKGSGRDAYIKSIWGNGEHDDIFEKWAFEKSMEDTPSVSAIEAKPLSKWANYQKPNNKELQEILTPIQYKVTQQEGTERPFQNEYWDNHEEGIYVDIVSGEPLFSSTDKYESGSGWPSFLKPLDLDLVTEHDDYKLIIKRTEIRSAYADSHLGHIILDGPVSNNKIRYCMNSAAMRFVPTEKLEIEGLEEYLSLFN